MMTTAAESDALQPGQLGTRHLLGVMAAVCLVAGLSAASIRSLAPERAAVVGVHWLLVAAVAAAFFGRGAFKRRRDRRAAGEMLLRVLRQPFTEQRRKWVAWGLTAAVIIDAVVMSVSVLPNLQVPTRTDDSFHFFAFGLQGVLIEGLMWGGCLDAWAGNVNWLGFHEHGLLTKDRFYPWPTISRIEWNPAKSPHFVVYGDYYLDMTLGPADFQAVSGVLAEIRQRIGPAAFTSGSAPCLPCSTDR